MGKNTQAPKSKKFSLSDAEFSKLAFFEDKRKAKELEYVFWIKSIDEVKQDILKRIAIDPAKYTIDWDNVWRNGEVICYEGVNIVGSIDPNLQKEIEKEQNENKQTQTRVQPKQN